ncbi:hypothetical protein [Oleisolibacter albus]|uniref:hypothetical protein n=1 Tax=Oleisolibacter albus TaxID=2171757 RepID=UPI000DF3C831|nr:hypothetical protein [Oleisolibacter albus]
MAINSLSGSSLSGSSASVFGAPGIRQPDPNIQPPIDPVDAVAANQKRAAADALTSGRQDTSGSAANLSSLNTAPTEDEREQALGSGRTRGAFVDIRA